MQLFWTWTVSGLTTAAIYAIAATGLVLTYTTTGVFNFAHGGVGMMAAFTYWQMRFGWGWPAPVAMVICVFILAPLFGALLERVIMRRLDGTSETTRLVVTLSLMLATVGAAVWIWDPTKARPIRKFWEGNVVTVFGVRIPYHQISALVVAGLIALALRVLLTKTRLGVAMRACVDDRNLASLNGARQARVAMASWAIGTSLAALAGILIAPTLALSQLPLTLLIINAYAAAMIGRLRSLPMTFVGALILGLATDYFKGYQDRIPIETKYLSGFAASMPIIVLFIVLLLLPQTRLRGHSASRTREIIRMPSWGGTATFGATAIIGAVLIAYVLPKSDLFVLNKMWGLAIVALSLIPLVGYAGQISLCQLSFAGIGMVMMHHIGAQGNPVALIWATVIPGLIGLVIALPSLRLSGIYLALSTAAFAVLMDRWIFIFPKFNLFGWNVDIFNSGSLNVRKTSFFGTNMQGHRAFFMFGAVMFTIAMVVVVAIRRSTYGQRLIALKDSPAACATLCMNPNITRLGVFGLSAAIAGFGGAIYGQALQAPTPQYLDFVNGLTILMVMVIGGLTSVGASLFAGLFVAAPILSNIFPSLSQLQVVMVGLAGIGLGNNPNGFIAADIRPNWNAFLGKPKLVAGLVAALLTAYALRIAGVIDNWPYAIASLVILAVAPGIARVVSGGSFAPPPRGGVAKPARPELSGPIEWLGVTQPMLPSDVAIIDRALALQAD